MNDPKGGFYWENESLCNEKVPLLRDLTYLIKEITYFFFFADFFLGAAFFAAFLGAAFFAAFFFVAILFRI